MASSYAFTGGKGKRKKERRKKGRKGRKKGKKEGKMKGRIKGKKKEKGGKERHMGLIYLPFYQVVLDGFESIRRNDFPRASPSFRYHCLLELAK